MRQMRKGAVQIRFEILEFLYYSSAPQLRTYIWRRATSLSYDDFLKHLLFLEKAGLVKDSGDGRYKLTPKGRKIYENLRNSLPSIL